MRLRLLIAVFLTLVFASRTVPAAIGAFALAGRWLVADIESADGTPRVALWHVR